MRKKVNWVLDADIRDCFGSFSHEWMVQFLQHRIGDRRVLRLIKKWLRAGVLEEGEWVGDGKGDSAGLGDFAAARERLPALRFSIFGTALAEAPAAGEVIVVRYADDSVLGFQHRADAERFLQEWRGRLQKSDWNYIQIKHA